ncbi:MAG: inverse autotransporter beta domain-containing protein, partial [Candidatus Eutrophobiaceae bacterium]
MRRLQHVLFAFFLSFASAEAGNDAANAQQAAVHPDIAANSVLSHGSSHPTAPESSITPNSADRLQQLLGITGANSQSRYHSGVGGGGNPLEIPENHDPDYQASQQDAAHAMHENARQTAPAHSGGSSALPSVLDDAGKELWHLLPKNQDGLEDADLTANLRDKVQTHLFADANARANSAMRSLVARGMSEAMGKYWIKERFHFSSTLAWQTNGGVLGEADAVIPLYGQVRETSSRESLEHDRALFLQPGVVAWETKDGIRRLDINAGLTYRFRVDEGAVGMSAFYDRNLDARLQRLGVGADYVAPFGYAALNYYHPLGGWRQGERKGYEEHALRGFDLRFEHQLPMDSLFLEGSSSLWRFWSEEQGMWRWRTGWSLGLRYRFAQYFSAYADYEYQHKDALGDRYSTGVEFSYPAKNPTGTHSQIVDIWRPVNREKRILYAERAQIPNSIGFAAADSGGITLSSRFPGTQRFVAELEIKPAVAQDLELVFQRTELPSGVTVADLDGLHTLRVPAGSASASLEFNIVLGEIPEDTLQLFTVILKSARFVGGRDVSSTIATDANTLAINLPINEFSYFPQTLEELVQIDSTGTNGRFQSSCGFISYSHENKALTVWRCVDQAFNVPIDPRQQGFDKAVTAQITTNSTAVEGSDYRLDRSTISWTESENGWKNIPITLLAGNAENLDSEYFRLIVQLVDPEGDIFSQGFMRVNIEKIPALSLQSNPASVNEGDNILLIVTTNQAAVPESLMAELTITGNSGAGFSATDSADFHGDWSDGNHAVTLDFNGSMTATATIPTANDAIREGTEGYTIMLQAGQSYTVLESVSSVNGIINDNDGIRIQAGQTGIDAAEGDTINVVLEVVSNGAVAPDFVKTVDVTWDYSGMGITAMVADFDSPPSSVDFST